jgi:predicted N-acetyltransferase YhbS
MDIALRAGTPEDAEACGLICYEAFRRLAEQHGFPPDFPSPEFATDVLSQLLLHPNFYAVVAEAGGRILGSNFMDERSTIAGIGPITVDPEIQNHAIGRRLMQDAMDRAANRALAGVRLCQAAYHNRSLALYAKLGFAVREPLSTLQGTPPRGKIAGASVRQAASGDIEVCNKLCERVHGHDRAGEVADAVSQGRATVVERDGRISGYATEIAFFGHAVGETNKDLMALIGAASEIQGPGLLVPSRNWELLDWGLDNGLRLVQQMTLMSTGFYREPEGSYLPSVLY